MAAYIVSLNPKINEKPGALIAIENGTIGFDVKRVFYIYGTQGDINRRGNHGHTNTTQFIVCLSGETDIETTYRDGSSQMFKLSSPNAGLMLPPFNHIVMNMKNNAILMVVCDAEFKDEISYTDKVYYAKFSYPPPS